VVAPPAYSAEAIEARVVDEDTGQPLEGVIVTANWELQAPLEGYPVGQMMVMETVTDAKGRFSFPTWGPKPRGPLTGSLTDKDPQLLLFKNGYKPRNLWNEIRRDPNPGPVRRSDWNSKTIKLKKFTGSLEEWARQVRFVDSTIDFAFFHHDCSWKQIPRMLTAVDQETKQFRQKNIYNNLHSIEDREERANSTKCGSIREFLRSHVP
jgi:hypothetical protein